MFKTKSLEINKTKLELQISEAKKGNQEAFRYLLDTFWSDVYFYQLKRTNNENDAEDITIRAFSKAFDKIDTFNNKYTFKTWLITISKNIYIDLVRKQQKSITTNTTKEQEEKAYLVADESLTAEDKIIREQNLATLLKDIKLLQKKRTGIQKMTIVCMPSLNTVLRWRFGVVLKKG